MEDYIEKQLAEDNLDCELTVKTKADVMAELAFADDEDKALCDSIIDVIERTAANVIRNDRVAQIPYIGTFRINPVKKGMFERKEMFRLLRKTMSPSEFKDYVRGVLNELKINAKVADRSRVARNKMKRSAKSKYLEYLKKYGYGYAEMYVLAMTMFKEVPFDSEWQDKFDELKEREEREYYIDWHGNKIKEIRRIMNASPDNVSLQDYLKATDSLDYRVKFE